MILFLGGMMTNYSEDLMDNLAVGVAVVDSIEGEEKIVYVNEMFTEITGFNLDEVPTVEEWYNKAYPDPEVREKTKRKFSEYLEKKHSEDTYIIHTKNGSYKYIEIKINILEEGKYVSNFIDITAKVEQNKKIKRQQQLLGKLFSNPIAGILILDGNYKCIKSNHIFKEIFGFSEGEIEGKNINELIAPCNSEKQIQDYIELLGKKINFKKEFKTLNNNGFLKDYSIYSFKIELPDGSDGYYAIFFDITDRKAKERELKETKDRLKMAVEGANIGIWDWDIESGEVYYDKNSANMLGYEEGDLEYHISSWKNIIHKEDLDNTLDILYKHLKGKNGIYEVEQRLKTKDGSYKWIKDLGRVSKRDENGNPLRAVGIHIDIDKEKRNKKEVEYLSFHDELTDLYNRRFFESEVARFENSRHYPLSIIIGDLDNLKKVNDMLGHPTGDHYIKITANILKRFFREEDVVARMGGDEFAVLLPETTENTAKNITRRIQDEFEKVNQAEDFDIPLSISFGYSTIQTSCKNFKECYHKADQMMYKYKAKNRG